MTRPRRSTATTTAARRTRDAVRPRRSAQGTLLADYAQRGSECAFANARMLGRILGNVYDEALRPVDLRASQLALLWAILACEPVELSRLERITQTDQTTLSRTVNTLRRLGWVAVACGQDRRTRIARLTPAGRRRFAQALPHWERAQREVDSWLPLDDLRRLARAARKQKTALAA